jgi:hypothetical protein
MLPGRPATAHNTTEWIYVKRGRFSLAYLPDSPSGLPGVLGYNVRRHPVHAAQLPHLGGDCAGGSVESASSEPPFE